MNAKLILFLFGIVTVVGFHSVLSAPQDQPTLNKYVASSKNSSYINCRSSFGDYILYSGPAEKSYKFLQKISLDLPVSTGNVIINCIEAIDVKADGDGAAVSVTSGGLGYNYVTLHFDSQRNHGIHFNVIISGH